MTAFYENEWEIRWTNTEGFLTPSTMLFSPSNGWVWSQLFQETVQRRDELLEEPGSGVLLSGAVCSEHHDCLCCRGFHSAKGWGLIEISTAVGNLSHCPSHSTLDIMEAVAVQPSRSCSGDLLVRTEVATTCPCSSLRPMGCHWKAGQLILLSKEVTKKTGSESHITATKPPNSQRPFRKAPLPNSHPDASRREPYDKFLFSWRMVQRSSVGLQAQLRQIPTKHEQLDT